MRGCYLAMEKLPIKSTRKPVTKAAFQQAYITYLLTHGKPPISIFQFAIGLKSSEQEFYKYFNSFKSLERSIWAGWFNETVQVLEADPAFEKYSIREKILALYFTWFERMLNNRSYFIVKIGSLDKKELNPYFLFTLKEHFMDFINKLLVEGKASQEVAERPFSNQYEKAFWLHFLFLNRFWMEDDSEGFEKTDAAIEKSVNLGLDLVGKGPLDSMIDFAKFLFQNRKPF